MEPFHHHRHRQSLSLITTTVALANSFVTPHYFRHHTYSCFATTQFIDHQHTLVCRHYPTPWLPPPCSLVTIIFLAGHHHLTYLLLPSYSFVATILLVGHHHPSRWSSPPSLLVTTILLVGRHHPSRRSPDTRNKMSCALPCFS